MWSKYTSGLNRSDELITSPCWLAVEIFGYYSFLMSMTVCVVDVMCVRALYQDIIYQ